MLIEGYIALALLAIILCGFVIRWADAQYQRARREARMAWRERNGVHRGR